MKSALLICLAALPLAAAAQTTPPTQAELLRRGELTGRRPSANRAVATRPAAARRPVTDPAQQHLLQTDLNLAQARAEQLPDLYARLIATTRDERRQWNDAQWDAAGQALARLNQRYEQVRTSLPLEERLRVRSLQGEFHTLRGARQVKERLD